VPKPGNVSIGILY